MRAWVGVRGASASWRLLQCDMQHIVKNSRRCFSKATHPWLATLGAGTHALLSTTQEEG